MNTLDVFRWTVAVDRALAGWSRGRRIDGVYRRPDRSGILARLRRVLSVLAWLRASG